MAKVMRTLVLGGVRSGKSRLAADLARESGLPVTYVATALPLDEEMVLRIAAHRAARAETWSVIEEPIALSAAIVRAGPRRCVVVDCLTLWLTNLLGASRGTLERERQALLKTVTGPEASLPSEIIFVANETNSGVVPRGQLTRRFCDEAGTLHQEVAQRCDRVLLCVAGISVELKGRR